MTAQIEGNNAIFVPKLKLMGKLRIFFNYTPSAHFDVEDITVVVQPIVVSFVFN
jgi:hypothetical protein